MFTVQWNYPTVVLNSPQAIHEGFVKNANTLSTRHAERLEITPLSALGQPRGICSVTVLIEVIAQLDVNTPKPSSNQFHLF